MGKCKVKLIQIDLGIFYHDQAYLDMLRHNQVYAVTIQAYSDILRQIQNPV